MIGDAYVGILHPLGGFDARYAAMGWQIGHLPYALAELWTHGTDAIPARDHNALAAVLLSHDWEYLGTPAQVTKHVAEHIAWLSQDGDEPGPDQLAVVIGGIGIPVSDDDDIDGPFRRITPDQLPDRAIAYLLDPVAGCIRLIPAGFPHPIQQAFRLDTYGKGTS